MVRVPRRSPWPALAFLALATPAVAAQLSAVRVTRDGARFFMRMHLAIDEPPAAVFEALRDYRAMPRFNPDLRAVRVQATREPDRVRLFTTVHACVLFLCKTLHQEQIMTAAADAHGGVLRAELVPGRGDFREGHGLWIVRPCHARVRQTCVDVQLELVPAFWVPPVIGPWAIRRVLYQEASRTSAGLEQVARRFASKTLPRAGNAATRRTPKLPYRRLR